MTLPLSAHAREAVDRIDARRKRERDLRIRRDTAVRAKALNERLREIAERNNVWDPAHNPARERYSTDSIPAQITEYLHDHGEAHTSRLALTLNRQYDAVLKALRRLEKNGDVACREEYGTRWWRLTYEEVEWPPTKQYAPKLDREELVRFVDDNPGVSVYEAARHFGAHQESVGRRFRELRDAGRLVDVLVDRSTPAQWFTPGAYMPPEDARGVVRWDALVGFVRAHPGCTTREVAAGVGARAETVRRALNKLSHSGRVRNRSAGAPLAHWEAVGD